MATLKVAVERRDDSFHFVGTNEQGVEVHMDDASERADGIGLGASPMQLLLVALGGCSGIDLASILSKGRLQIDRIHIDIQGDKPDGVAPSLFERIHVVFHVDGDVDEKRVSRAVDLSLGKYCSVAKTLEPTATITASYVVNGVSHDWEPAA
ncbi:MAG: OsmC family protein [Rhodothermales bacterium]|nr:OsmC family protein [Rhodothermales bacterium]MBO6779802.1 OsmC family protein [Rhodothermales bacterium]